MNVTSVIAAVLGLCAVHVYSAPSTRKIPLSINVCGSIPSRVKVIPLQEFPGGLHYLILDNSRHKYVIGDVIDEGLLVLPGDPTAVSRYVLVFVMEDESKYLKITTRHRHGRVYKTQVEEFLRKPWDSGYKRVSRLPIDLDVTTRNNSNIITAEFILPSEPEGLDTQSSHPQDLALLPIRFSVKRDKIGQFVIGEVRFCGYVIANEISGLELIARKVLWRGGLADPRITIMSKYSDGSEIEGDYRFEAGKSDGFVIERVRRRVVTLCE